MAEGEAEGRWLTCGAASLWLMNFTEFAKCSLKALVERFQKCLQPPSMSVPFQLVKENISNNCNLVISHFLLVVVLETLV